MLTNQHGYVHIGEVFRLLPLSSWREELAQAIEERATGDRWHQVSFLLMLPTSPGAGIKVQLLDETIWASNQYASKLFLPIFSLEMIICGLLQLGEVSAALQLYWVHSHPHGQVLYSYGNALLGLYETLLEQVEVSEQKMHGKGKGRQELCLQACELLVSIIDS